MTAPSLNPLRIALIVAVVGGTGLLPLAGCATDTPASGAKVTSHVEDWRDEVIYEILVDRFDDGDAENDTLDGIGPTPDDLARHQGGDWAGIANRLDYLENLGVTALWISPIVDNVQRTEEEDGYHGYWARDFTRLNPRYGDLATLRALVDAAHARGIKIIIDVVVNHTGRVFTYDLDRDGEVDADELEPPYASGPIDAPLAFVGDAPQLFAPSEASAADPFAESGRLVLGAEHFHRRGASAWDSQESRLLGDFPTGLRDLATERADVMDALVETYAYWVRETDVDGFRLDAVPHIDRIEWAAFCRRLRARLAAMGKHRFLLLGEVFSANPTELTRYLGRDMLDSVFDFTFREDVINGVILGGAAPTTARRALEEMRRDYPSVPQPMGIELSPLSARVAFADNHDTPRLRYILDDPLAVELAMTAVFTVDAIPAIYYGTEQGLDGGYHHEAREVLWRTGFDETTGCFAHIARLAALRRGHVALRRGSFTLRYLSEQPGTSSRDDASVMAWEREADGDRLLVVMNAHAFGDKGATIPTGFGAGTRLHDLLWDAVAPIEVTADGNVEVLLPPRSSVVLGPR